ncbi:MAG: CoA transferase [Gammaproteobacteria bacterium]|nr:CoA transferase [Gammaproteobacteria bacterium]
MAGPLTGIKIIDLTTVLMGPYATQQLGDMGADVVKIESADGDVIRYASKGRSKGMSGLFLNNNRNKRSLVLDLKQKEGLEVLLKLVGKSDVLISNMRPGAMRRLGLTYQEIAPINEKLVFITCSGFGSGGPYEGRPAYDDIIQTMAGIPGLIARAYGEEPTFVPSNFCDRVTGLKVVSSVVSALFHREHSGKGQSVNIPMFETMVEFLMSDHLGGHTFVPPMEQTGYKRIVNPNRRPYRTKDGYLALMLYNDKQWAEFLGIVGKPELLEQEPFATFSSRSENVVEVYNFVRETLAGRTTAEWLEAFKASDLAHAPVKELEDLFDDEHLQAIGFFPELMHPSEGRIRATAIPDRWSDSQPEFQRHAPRLGQHSREVLLELGLSNDEIQALADKNIINRVEPHS